MYNNGSYAIATLQTNKFIKNKNTENQIINSVLIPLKRGSSGWQD